MSKPAQHWLQDMWKEQWSQGEWDKWKMNECKWNEWKRQATAVLETPAIAGSHYQQPNCSQPKTQPNCSQPNCSQTNNTAIAGAGRRDNFSIAANPPGSELSGPSDAANAAATPKPSTGSTGSNGQPTNANPQNQPANPQNPPAGSGSASANADAVSTTPAIAGHAVELAQVGHDTTAIAGPWRAPAMDAGPRQSWDRAFFDNHQFNGFNYTQHNLAMKALRQKLMDDGLHSMELVAPCRVNRIKYRQPKQSEFDVLADDPVEWSWFDMLAQMTGPALDTISEPKDGGTVKVLGCCIARRGQHDVCYARSQRGANRDSDDPCDFALELWEGGDRIRRLRY